ncbi:MCE family protein [Rhodococcus sp. 06-235-1A]|uniref:MCE family protein n=1 Tax=Rhodococcus sp. 06-235-1A TaxID=2022508 RepID=UPI0015C5C44E|nr:MCE family protein [Rhodococcus sp. 06-235-1A]
MARQWKRPVVVAVSLVAVAALTGTVASASGSLDVVSRTSSVCAEFTDTVGLYEGNSVTMLGVAVGTVTSISADAGVPDGVLVTMEVDDNLALPAEVGAVTLSSSVVTDRHVEFTEPYTDGPEFDRAQCIPLARTRTPLGASETFDAVSKLATDLLGPADADGNRPEILGNTLRSLDGALDGSGPQLNSAIQQLSVLVGEPTDRDATVRRLIDNIDKLVDVFAVNWPDVAKLLDNLKAGMITLSEFTTEFAGAVDLAVDFIPVLERQLDKYADKVYGFLDQLIPIVDVGLGRIGDIKDILEQVPTVSDSLVTLYDEDLRAGRLTYHPPQFEIDTNSPNEICAVINKYRPTCSADQQRGDVIDVGLVQLILGSAGWR